MEEQEKKVSITLTAEDKPLSMLSWGADATADYGNVYSRKNSESKDQQAAIWTSMYEKSLRRKVSDLPPWIDPSKADKKFGNPESTDLASIHLQRAAESGAAHSCPIITQTAEERRHHRKHHHHHKHRSGSTDDPVIKAFHEKISQGDGGDDE